jgi:hypothetical protein
VDKIARKINETTRALAKNATAVWRDPNASWPKTVWRRTVNGTLVRVKEDSSTIQPENVLRHNLVRRLVALELEIPEIAVSRVSVSRNSLSVSVLVPHMVDMLPLSLRDSLVNA